MSCCHYSMNDLPPTVEQKRLSISQCFRKRNPSFPTYFLPYLLTSLFSFFPLNTFTTFIFLSSNLECWKSGLWSKLWNDWDVCVLVCVCVCVPHQLCCDDRTAGSVGPDGLHISLQPQATSLSSTDRPTTVRFTPRNVLPASLACQSMASVFQNIFNNTKRTFWL